MAIKIVCSACKKEHEVEDSRAGNAASCAACGNMIPIPAVPPPVLPHGNLGTAPGTSGPRPAGGDAASLGSAARVAPPPVARPISPPPPPDPPSSEGKAASPRENSTEAETVSSSSSGESRPASYGIRFKALLVFGTLNVMSAALGGFLFLGIFVFGFQGMKQLFCGILGHSMWVLVVLGLVDVTMTGLLIVSGIGCCLRKDIQGRQMGNAYGTLGIFRYSFSVGLFGWESLLTMVPSLVYPVVTLVLLNTVFRKEFPDAGSGIGTLFPAHWGLRRRALVLLAAGVIVFLITPGPAVRLGKESEPTVDDFIRVANWESESATDCPHEDRLQRLKSANPEERAAAVFAISAAVELGEEKAKSVVPELMPLLRDKEWKVRRAASQALRTCGAEAECAVPVFAEWLRDPSPEVRVYAANALGAIGPGARSAIPALRGLWEDKDMGRFAKIALESIEGRPSSPAGVPRAETGSGGRNGEIAPQAASNERLGTTNLDLNRPAAVPGVRWSLEGIAVGAVAFSPDGRRLAGCCGDGSVRVWDLKSGKQLYRRHLEGMAFQCLDFSPDSRVLAAGTGAATIHLFDAASGTQNRQMKTDSDAVRGLVFSVSGRTLVSIHDGQHGVRPECGIRMWEPNTGEMLGVPIPNITGLSTSLLRGKGLLYVGRRSGINVVNPDTGESIAQFDHQLGLGLDAFGTAVSPNGARLVAAQQWGGAVVLDAPSLKVVSGFGIGQQTYSADAPNVMSFSPDGSLLVCGTRGDAAYLWSANDWRLLRRIQPNGSYIVFSPDGVSLATSGVKGMEIRDVQAMVLTRPVENGLVNPTGFWRGGSYPRVYFNFSGGNFDGWWEDATSATGRATLKGAGRPASDEKGASVFEWTWTSGSDNGVGRLVIASEGPRQVATFTRWRGTLRRGDPLDTATLVPTLDTDGASPASMPPAAPPSRMTSLFAAGYRSGMAIPLGAVVDIAAAEKALCAKYSFVGRVGNAIRVDKLGALGASVWIPGEDAPLILATATTLEQVETLLTIEMAWQDVIECLNASGAVSHAVDPVQQLEEAAEYYTETASQYQRISVLGEVGSVTPQSWVLGCPAGKPAWTRLTPRITSKDEFANEFWLSVTCHEKSLLNCRGDCFLPVVSLADLPYGDHVLQASIRHNAMFIFDAFYRVPDGALKLADAKNSRGLVQRTVYSKPTSVSKVPEIPVSMSLAAAPRGDVSAAHLGFGFAMEVPLAAELKLAAVRRALENAGWRVLEAGSAVRADHPGSPRRAVFALQDGRLICACRGAPSTWAEFQDFERTWFEAAHSVCSVGAAVPESSLRQTVLTTSRFYSEEPLLYQRVYFAIPDYDMLGKWSSWQWVLDVPKGALAWAGGTYAGYDVKDVLKVGATIFPVPVPNRGFGMSEELVWASGPIKVLETGTQIISIAPPLKNRCGYQLCIEAMIHNADGEMMLYDNCRRCIATHRAYSRPLASLYLPGGTPHDAPDQPASEGGARPPETPPLPPSDHGLTVIDTPQAFDTVLTRLPRERVVWLKLEKKDLAVERLALLRAWVEQGGVLWLSTDLAGEFGFPVTAAPEKRTTMFTNPAVTHDVLKGFDKETPVTIGHAPGDVLIVGELLELATQMTPLLAWSASASSVRALVACAERKQGHGVLVFRPRQIDTASDAGRTFEENLRTWSFAFARAPAANDKQPMSSDAIPPDPMAQAPGTARLWKDRTGSFSVEAQYLGFADNQVRLRRTGGQEICVALERLSEADQQYVSQIRQTGRADDASSH